VSSRYFPRGRRPLDEESRERDERETPRDVPLARESGDPRWGTGGMPVDEYHALRETGGGMWPPGPRDEIVQRTRGYAEWESSRSSGPYVGRGPRGYHRSDERILEEVCERFTEHGQLDPSDVEVTVHGGEVTLEGTVATRAQKRLAEDLAEAVFGVEEVHNHLRLHRAGEGRAHGGPEARNQ